MSGIYGSHIGKVEKVLRRENAHVVGQSSVTTARDALRKDKIAEGGLNGHHIYILVSKKSDRWYIRVHTTGGRTSSEPGRLDINISAIFSSHAAVVR